MGLQQQKAVAETATEKKTATRRTFTTSIVALLESSLSAL
jgi:hypothetical protein